MRYLKRLKNATRRLLAPTGLTRRPPDQVIWRDGEPDCGAFSIAGVSYRTITRNGLRIAVGLIEACDLFIVAVSVINGLGRDIVVSPRLSALAIWRDDNFAPEPLERLRPTSSLPADLLEAKRLAPKESIAGELYFHRKTFGAACFVMLINGVFYEFAISPAQESGAIEGRT